MFLQKTFIYTQVVKTSLLTWVVQGKTVRSLAVHGSTHLVKLSNHLAQVHGMDIAERAKWLKWGKLEMCVPRHHGNGTDYEVNMEKTLQELLKRIDDIDT